MQIKKTTIFMITLITVAAVLILPVCDPLYASDLAFETDSGKQISYNEYQSKYQDQVTPQNKIIIEADDNFTDNNASVSVVSELDGKNDVLMWDSQKGSVSWEFENANAGNYVLAIEYYPIKGKGLDIEIAVAINGQIPFEESTNIVLPRSWKDVLDDNGDFYSDSRGNHVLAEQIETPCWSLINVSDREGVFTEPFQYYINEGINEIELFITREALAIKSIILSTKKVVPEYSKPKDVSYEQNDLPDLIMIQAEKPIMKSHSHLNALVDRSNPGSTPYDPVKVRLNTFGGEAWRFSGQRVKWEFQVDKPGYYAVGTRYRQNFVRGLYTMRKILIDDEEMFGELKSQKFPYGITWQTLNFNNGSEDMLFFFDEGKHSITFEPTIGSNSEILRKLNDCQFRLNEMYRKIIMITSIQPDIFQDYELEVEIPELLSTFSNVSETLDIISSDFEDKTGYKGSEAAVLRRISEQIISFTIEPDTIPERLQKFRENLSGLSAWIMRLKEQPLEIDYIYLIPANTDKPDANKGFLAQLIHEIQSFWGTFFEDYNTFSSIDEQPDDESIEVWTSGGRDQANVLNRLINDIFTPEYGINVNLKLVQGALIQAVMSGIGPDLAINIGRGDPVNLALRGALSPLDDFNGFEDVRRRFSDGALIPYMMQNKTYALPESQIFHMMFYRTDIFKELGLTLPDTWEDFYAIAKSLQRNNLEVGLPYVQADAYNIISMGMGATSIFPTLLMQNGGSFYTEDGSATALDNTIAYDVFAEWVDFYKQYSFSLFKDDFNRFRTGEMPLTINQYTFYNQLLVAAPEIKNLWEMSPIPGTIQKDGKINRTESASGTAAIMLADPDNGEYAWSFLDWWTSTDIQSRYGINMESLLGPAARYATANTEAFDLLPWSQKEAGLIKEQWKFVREIPEVPGGYYVSRNIDNAFKAAIYRNENPREMLSHWNSLSNTEIARKRKEFKLDND